jgi:hypothetical protein
MPINVTCKCGQRFAAKDELAGKVVKCPKCKQPLKIGSPQAAPTAPPATATGSEGLGDLLDEVGFHVHEDKEHVQHCPACDAEMSDHAILCVECGYHLETGKFAKGAGVVSAADKKEGHAGAADMLLKKAEHAIETDKLEEKKMRKQGMPTWLIATLLVILVVFGITMSLLPRSTAMVISGVTWMSVIGLANLYFQVKLIIIAFDEGIAQGLMYLFIPFYALIFVFTRWDKCSTAFLATIVLGTMWNVGWMLISAASAFPDVPEDPNVSLPRRFARERVVVCAPAMIPQADTTPGGWTWDFRSETLQAPTQEVASV